MKSRLAAVVFSAIGLMLAGSAVSAQPPIIETEKSMYYLDPYYWVYSASLYEWQGENQELWPADGHDIEINFSLAGYEGSQPLTFTVDGLAEPVEGVLEEDVDMAGIYRGSFTIGESSVGAELFKPGEKDEATGELLVPRAVTLTISDMDGTVARREVRISRWGCDRCHLSQADARVVYPWSSPAGGPRGPHSWPNVLGRNGGRPGFTYDNLTNDALTHTPTVGGYVTDRSTGEQVWRDNPLNRQPYHQKTNLKMPWSAQCSPCHQGSGHVRAAFKVEGQPLPVTMERSTVVKCVFCHGVSGGYVPDEPKPMWEDWVLQGWN